MTDQELAQRIVDYVERLRKLMDSVSDILNIRGRVDQHIMDVVRNSYKEFKEEIKADAHYVSLARNEDYGNKLYSAFLSHPYVRHLLLGLQHLLL